MGGLFALERVGVHFLRAKPKAEVGIQGADDAHRQRRGAAEANRPRHVGEDFDGHGAVRKAQAFQQQRQNPRRAGGVFVGRRHALRHVPAGNEQQDAGGGVNDPCLHRQRNRRGERRAAIDDGVFA